MRQIYPALWHTRLERPVPDEAKGAANAYLLVREMGNILFYNVGREAIANVDDESDLRQIEEAGGIPINSSLTGARCRRLSRKSRSGLVLRLPFMKSRGPSGDLPSMRPLQGCPEGSADARS